MSRTPWTFSSNGRDSREDLCFIFFLDEVPGDASVVKTAVVGVADVAKGAADSSDDSIDSEP